MELTLPRPAVYIASAVNADLKPQSSIHPISSSWAESKLACSMNCFLEKECKTFVFTGNTCTIYSEEMAQVTFESDPGARVYYRFN